MIRSWQARKPRQLPQGPQPTRANRLPNSPLPTDLQLLGSAYSKSMSAPILSPFATLGVIVVVAIFALLQKEDLRDRAIRLFGSTDLQRTTVAMDEAGQAAEPVSGSARHQLGFGVIVGIGLYFIGVPSPVLWGILCDCCGLFPYIGSFISAGLPIVLAAAVDPGWSMVVWTAALYLAVELAMGQARTLIVRSRHGALPPRRGRRRDLLDLVMGVGRPVPLDPAHAVSRLTWPVCRSSGVSRHAARRSAGADTGGEFLSAHPAGDPDEAEGTRPSAT